MLVFTADIETKTSVFRSAFKASDVIESALVRPSEIVDDALTEVVTISQRSTADTHESGVQPLHFDRFIVGVRTKFQFRSEFPVQRVDILPQNVRDAARIIESVFRFRHHVGDSRTGIWLKV